VRRSGKNHKTACEANTGDSGESIQSHGELTTDARLVLRLVPSLPENSGDSVDLSTRIDLFEIVQTGKNTRMEVEP
jgi:hypothetical protein